MHGLSFSEARGISPDQGSNPGPCTGRWILIHCTTQESRREVSEGCMASCHITKHFDLEGNRLVTYTVYIMGL